MPTREELLDSIATLIADYRQGEIAPIDRAHVERWVLQFDVAVQEPILEEMIHVLDKTYFKKHEIVGFLSTLVEHPKLAGDNPCVAWRNVKFLRIQQGGTSQIGMLSHFDEVLGVKCGYKTGDCGLENPESYIYLDDFSFTGGRVRSDLCAWIKGEAPANAKVNVVVIGYHTGGQYYAKGQIAKCATEAKKDIEVTWWRATELEERLYSINVSDVLRPTAMPNDAAVQAYAAAMTHQPTWRTGTSVGGKGLFSSAAGRHLLEQEFLKAGVRVRNMCPYLPPVERPLGHHGLETLGFGSMLVTHRNCPNNAPLALWAGHPWRPLFPRRTN